ncbi:MAG: type II CRISPR RNA-guided endonuclease Cas9 [Planctomycetaceae bacterium]|nr:type II CRISPR RNA-guided endonuclease Cas9 [Planctomycetaceae bacterium]
MKYNLGLDLGVQSIGWAIIPVDENNGPAMRLGVRCFDTVIDNVKDWQEGTLGKDGKPKAQTNNRKRSDARGVRKNQWRRKRRTLKLFNLLRNHGLLPMGKGINDDPLDRQELINHLDKELARKLSLNDDRVSAHLLPYKLRAMALDQQLEPFAFGRALLHLSQRRGFLSNKKTPPKDDEDEKGLKKDISDLRGKIAECGYRTLGEYFASLDPEEKRIRQRWTGRDMFKDEFKAICDSQDKYYHDLLNKKVVIDSWKNKPGAWKYDIKEGKRKKIFSNEHFRAKEMTLQKAIERTLFFQRPLKSQKHLIGKCQLERGKRRAQLASLEAQRFRYWQKILDLKYKDVDGFMVPLSIEQQDILAKEFENNDHLTYAQIRSLLGFKQPRQSKEEKERHKKAGIQPVYAINFEIDDENEKLKGNVTSERIRKIIPERWNAMPDEEKEQLVSEILQFEDENALARRLEKVFKFDSSKASELAMVQLERGYASLSKQAIGKILPVMKAKRIRFATARKDVYGEQFDEERKDVKPDLPPVLNVVKDLKNPVVTRALTELRKVVNAIIRKYGKPDMICVELSRDMKRSRPDREKLAEEMKQQEKRRAAVVEIIREYRKDKNYEPKKNEILKVLLAEECNWECPYTGTDKDKHWGKITLDSLLGSEPQFDIEHILPLSRSLDNSFVNKTLCRIYANRHEKKNQTPWEDYGHDEQRWHEIMERVERFQGPLAKIKHRRFEMKKIPDGFTNRHLNDTRHISRLAGEYLALLYGGRSDAEGTQRIQVSSGGVTKYLRDEWGLNAILDDGGDEKNRNDHRHHAVDAGIIAVSAPKIVKMLSDAAERGWLEGRQRFGKGGIEEPFPDFYKKMEAAVNKINISFRANRKVSGGFHEETNYSKPQIVVEGKGKKAKQVEYRHVRKPIASMSKNEVHDIVDEKVRNLVLETLKSLGTDDPRKLTENDLPYLRSKDGKRMTPIRKARIRKSDSTRTMGLAKTKKGGNPEIHGRTGRERHVVTGNNHHMEIFAHLDDQDNEVKLDWKVVNLFDSVQRIKQKQPVISRFPDGEQTRLKFSLAKGEYVLATPPGEDDVLLKVCKISEGDLSLCLHTDARPEKDRAKTGDFQKYRIASIKKLEQFKLRKVTVDVLGNIHPAND